MTVRMYGIPNCDTVKKARKWLGDAGVDYDFHDYKKLGADRATLQAWAGQVGWERLLNRAGTTFRKLDEAEKSGIDQARAIDLMVEHPSMIRRPVVETSGDLLVGFDPATWHGKFDRK